VPNRPVFAKSEVLWRDPRLLQARPECVFQADAGLVAVTVDRFATRTHDLEAFQSAGALKISGDTVCAA